MEQKVFMYIGTPSKMFDLRLAQKCIEHFGKPNTHTHHWAIVCKLHRTQTHCGFKQNILKLHFSFDTASKLAFVQFAIIRVNMNENLTVNQN